MIESSGVKHCKYCDLEITWKKNSQDKWIAVDAENERLFPDNEPQWHNCSGREYKPERKYCNQCGKEIDFDENQKSVSGKFIPIDWDTEQPHKCQKSRNE